MRTLQTAMIAAAALLAGTAMASAQEAYTTSDVNMRAGPGTRFPVVVTIPEDRDVDLYGCLDDLDWCDVSWGGERGWVFSDYLDYVINSRPVTFYEYRRRVDLPVVAFSFNYWDRHYRNRPWFGNWDRWGGRWRDRNSDVRIRIRDRDANDRNRDDDDSRARIRDRNREFDNRDGSNTDNDNVRRRDRTRLNDDNRRNDDQDNQRVNRRQRDNNEDMRNSDEQDNNRVQRRERRNDNRDCSPDINGDCTGSGNDRQRRTQNNDQGNDQQ